MLQRVWVQQLVWVELQHVRFCSAFLPPLQQFPSDDQVLQFVQVHAAYAGGVGVVMKIAESRTTRSAIKAKRGDLTTLAIISILSCAVMVEIGVFAHALNKKKCAETGWRDILEDREAL